MEGPPTFAGLVELVDARAEGSSPLEMLEIAAGIASEMWGLADTLVDHFVTVAREQGATWSEVGARLQVSKQAAQQRLTSHQSIVRMLLAKSSAASPGEAGAAGASSVQRLGRLSVNSFTGRARMAIAAAHEEAVARGASSVGVVDVLDGLAHEDDSVGQLLRSWRLEAPIGLDGGSAAADRPTPVRLPFDESTKRALVAAASHAATLDAVQVDAGHLLLGVLEVTVAPSERERQAVLGTVVGGNAGQIAEAMGIAESTLKRHLNSVRKQLQLWLTQ